MKPTKTSTLSLVKNLRNPEDNPDKNPDIICI